MDSQQIIETTCESCRDFLFQEMLRTIWTGKKKKTMKASWRRSSDLIPKYQLQGDCVGELSFPSPRAGTSRVCNTGTGADIREAKGSLKHQPAWAPRLLIGCTKKSLFKVQASLNPDPGLAISAALHQGIQKFYCYKTNVMQLIMLFTQILLHCFRSDP